MVCAVSASPSIGVGDETLKAAGKNECQQQRSSEDKSKNTGVKLQQLRRHRAQVGQQIKRSFAFAVTDNRLREENSIPVNAETGSDTRRFEFEFIVCGAENRETLSIRQFKARADDLRHRLQPGERFACRIFILEHDSGGAVVSGDPANDRELVRGMLLQSVGLNREKRRAREQQDHARNEHDYKRDLLSNWAIAQVLHAG